MTLFEALTGGAFDRLNWQHSGEFDKNFSKKSNAPGFARGGWAVLELTGTLYDSETSTLPCFLTQISNNCVVRNNHTTSSVISGNGKNGEIRRSRM